MQIQLADATASALADLITTLADAGSGPAVVNVYDGTLPTDLDPSSSTLLATFVLVDPAAAAAVAGVADWDFTTPVDATVAADGDAGWYRIEDSDGNPVTGGDVGGTASDASMTFTSVSWITGGTVSLTAGAVTEPDAG